jgi:hypothetical protein
VRRFSQKVLTLAFLANVVASDTLHNQSIVKSFTMSRPVLSPYKLEVTSWTVFVNMFSSLSLRGERRCVGPVFRNTIFIFFVGLLNFLVSQVATLNFEVECLQTFRQGSKALFQEETVRSENLGLPNQDFAAIKPRAPIHMCLGKLHEVSNKFRRKTLLLVILLSFD